MTAQRWWVRLAARWLARIDGVSGQLRLAFLAMTGVSTALVALRSYGHGQYAWPVIIGTGLTAIVYTYLYTEGGVWNQKQRDQRDLSNNFAGPNALIVQTIGAVALAEALNDEELTDEDREAIREEAQRMWLEFRDGVEIPEDE